MRTRIFSGGLTLLLAFSALANGGHDLWAATSIYLALLCFGVALLFDRCWGESAPGLSICLPFALAGVAAAMALSFRQSVHPEESWLGMMDWLAAMLVFVIAQNVFREKRYLDDLLAAAGTLLCFEAALILYQHDFFAVEGIDPGLWLVRYVVEPQVPGTLVNSSAATAFILLWTPVLIAQALAKRRWFWTAGAAAAIVGLIFLKSAWGMMCLAAAAPLLTGPRPLLEWTARRPRLAAAGAASFAVLIIVGLIFKLSHYGNTSRLYWWASGLSMFCDHPWLGVGIGNFPSAYPAYKIGAVQNTLYAHNSVVSLLSETGIVGTASVAAFLFLFSRRLRTEKKSVSERWPYLLGLMIFALFGAVGLSLEYLANLATCGLFLGILAAPMSAPKWKPRRSALLVVAALSVSAAPWLVSPLMASRFCMSGWEALASRDPLSSVKEFSSAASLDPRSSDARLGLSLAMLARYQLTHDPKDLEESLARRKEAQALNALQRIAP
jgi:O-antigen ligase